MIYLNNSTDLSLGEFYMAYGLKSPHKLSLEAFATLAVRKGLAQTYSVLIPMSGRLVDRVVLLKPQAEVYASLNQSPKSGFKRVPSNSDPDGCIRRLVASVLLFALLAASLLSVDWAKPSLPDSHYNPKIRNAEPETLG